MGKVPIFYVCQSEIRNIMLADSSATVYIAGILGIGDLPTVTQQQR